MAKKKSIKKVNDFFSQLKSAEAKKKAVGTIHSTSHVQDERKQDEEERKKEWMCSRENCSTSNVRQSTKCKKCGALRRISNWR